MATVVSLMSREQLWRAWEVSLLSLTLWREARGEGTDALVAVAWCVRNRVERPTWWGHDYVSVLAKRWQFSSLTDPRDRQLTNWPAPEDGSFEKCLQIADGVIAGFFPCPFPGADSYHDASIAPPAWTEKARRCGTIGRLTFYDVDHDYQDSQRGLA